MWEIFISRIWHLISKNFIIQLLRFNLFVLYLWKSETSCGNHKRFSLSRLPQLFHSMPEFITNKFNWLKSCKSNKDCPSPIVIRIWWTLTDFFSHRAKKFTCSWENSSKGNALTPLLSDNLPDLSDSEDLFSVNKSPLQNGFYSLFSWTCNKFS